MTMRNGHVNFDRVALLLILLNINTGNVIYFGDPAARVISYLLGMVLVASLLKGNWQFKKGNWEFKEKITLQGHILSGGSFLGVLFFLFSKEFGFIGFVFALGCLLSFNIKEDDRNQIKIFMAATILVAIFDYCYYHSSLLWHAVKAVNHLLMGLIGALTGIEMLFGHHASGFLILVPFVFYIPVIIICSAICSKARGKRIIEIWINTILSLLLLFISHAIYLCLQQIIFSRIQLEMYKNFLLLTPFETHWLAFLLFLIPLYIAHEKLTPLNGSWRITCPFKDSSGESRSGLKWISLTFLLLLSLILWPKGKVSPYLSRDNKSILIYDNLDWSVPVFGQYGEMSGGMFGNLPHFLRSLGYRVKVDNIITQEKLGRIDALVIINLMKKFDEQTNEMIRHYVETGGSLLIMGDHTGFGFIREPFNELLKPLHIAFQFDSARSFVPSWQNCMEIRPHPITEHVETESDTQIWTGASLTIRYPANPILVGRQAFSDAGNIHNSKDGFLGDFCCHSSEWLGDIVLAAEERYGKGKVLVFGDTSSVQNGALPHSWAFAQDIFQWLTEDKIQERPWYSQLWLRLSFFLSLSESYSSPLRGYSLCRSDSRKVAYIDNSHGEFFDLTGWQKNSIDGLVFNLMRNQYMPFITKTMDSLWLNYSKMGIFISPTKAFSRAEKAALRYFMQGGGVILWTAGWPIQEATLTLLADFGLSFINLPLGPAKEKYKDYEVQFQDAWPIRIEERVRPMTRVLLQKGEYPLVVFQKYGQGGMLLISDNRFLLNHNLEHVGNFFHEGNILFLKEIIKDLC